MITGNLGGVKIGDNVNPLIMGIINLSPTSFYKKSILHSREEIISHLIQMEKHKANFVDVGATSSAPTHLYENRASISLEREIEILKTFFDALKEINLKIPISIDTQSSKTADFALSHGASIINDISGFKYDSNMPSVISEYNASTIIMACMNNPGDVFNIEEIKLALKNSISLGIDANIDKNKIIIDPGIGGWIPERNHIHDCNILWNLPEFRCLNQGILVGISRKSFIGKILGVTPEYRLWGSLAATTIAILKGAHVIRTHDVQETRDVSLVSDFFKCRFEKEG
ncbi:dihydropteroate synthase [Candidatus Hodarchaeum mangrovi]